MNLPILFIALSFLISVNLFGQATPVYIGDKIPASSFGKLLDDTSKLLNRSDVKGKLLILDFWNVQCKGCISTMPKMDSLQQKYNNELQVIYITFNTRKEVSDLFSRISIQKPNIPFVVADSLWYSKIFPHYGDPLHVWIDSNGTVLYITSHHNATDKNIQEVLSGKRPRLSLRSDYMINASKPLLSEENSGLLKLAKTYSILIQLHENSITQANRREYDDSGNLIRIFISNKSIVEMFSIAYSKDIYGKDISIPGNYANLYNNRLRIEVQNPSSLFLKSSDDVDKWTSENVYSYEAKSELGKEDLFKIMQADMNRFFAYRAEKENRRVLCLVLKKLNATGKGMARLKASIGDSWISVNSDSTIVNNYPFQDFIRQLIVVNQSSNLKDFPIIDETRLTSKVKMVLKCRLDNLYDLNRELRSYGLQITKEFRQIPMVIIKDKR